MCNENGKEGKMIEATIKYNNSNIVDISNLRLLFVLQLSVPNTETHHFLPSAQAPGPVSWLLTFFFCWAFSQK